MSDRDEIYDYIKREINPYGRPFKGTAFEFGVKIMDYIKNMSDKSGWIPVSERLPEKDGRYLVTFKYGIKVCMVGYGSCKRTVLGYPIGHGWYSLEEAQYYAKDGIIAWMPLPEPYKEDDQNGHKINILDIRIQKETLQMLLSDM